MVKTVNPGDPVLASDYNSFWDETMSHTHTGGPQGQILAGTVAFQPHSIPFGGLPGVRPLHPRQRVFFVPHHLPTFTTTALGLPGVEIEANPRLQFKIGPFALPKYTPTATMEMRGLRTRPRVYPPVVLRLLVTTEHGSAAPGTAKLDVVVSAYGIGSPVNYRTVDQVFSFAPRQGPGVPETLGQIAIAPLEPAVPDTVLIIAEIGRTVLSDPTDYAGRVYSLGLVAYAMSDY